MLHLPFNCNVLTIYMLLVLSLYKCPIFRVMQHIDTAQMYKNEQDIGKGLQELFKSGAVKREDLFVTSKLCTILVIRSGQASWIVCPDCSWSTWTFTSSTGELMARSAHGHSRHQVFRLASGHSTTLLLTITLCTSHAPRLHHFSPSSYLLPNQHLVFALSLKQGPVPVHGMALLRHACLLNI